ncbi:MAG: DUF5723 family protein [Bacteroidales bacterium]
MQILRGIIVLLFLAVLHLKLLAQQDNTLFHMHNIPQSNFINPAVQIKCQTYVGVPLLSSFHLNVNSTGFSYSSFANGSSSLDLNALVAQMHSWDYLSAEVHYTPVSFGFMYDSEQYFNFAWTERVETKVFIPKKLLSLLVDGNSQYLGDGMETRNPGVNAMYYREFSFGYSKEVESDLTIGFHTKLLFGLGGIFTRRKPVKLEVDALTHNLYGTWNPEVDVAYPVSVSTDADGNVTDVSPDGFSPVSFLLNFGNQGLATDWGFIWKRGDITWSGSVLDLGLIWWHKQTTRFENKGEFAYRGATTTDLDNPDAYINELTDSIDNQIQFKYRQGGFITLLNPKVYLGGSYPVYERVNVGGHLRSEWYPGRPVLGLTVSATAFGKRGGSASVSYSVMNGTMMNVGLGFGWGGESFQFYMMSDNVMVAFYPEKARNVNLRFGFNMFFGCKEKKKEKSFRTRGYGCYWQWDDKTKKRRSRR